MENKVDIILCSVFGIFIFLGFTGGYPICWEHDSYDSYVDECEYCHSINKSWLYCSGFCVEPNQQIIQKDDNTLLVDPCGVGVLPDQDCASNIPHGSATGLRDCIWD